MPKRADLKTILIIGAGPIIIGQACEFDYSGTQAVKALKAEGYKIVLVNSNPATIMTDPDLADATYIEPITPDVIEQIIKRERPDALLPTMGGQTALNAALAVYKNGVLDKYGVELIGAQAEAIEKAEDRQKFRLAMEKIGLDCPRSSIAHTIDEAEAALTVTGLPAIIRPSFTLGGTGGGIAYNKVEFLELAAGGLDASPTTEILIEESLIGWKEYEMEVVRDKNDNAIIICSIENIDPMGVHTGDSITVAPALTLTDKEYQIMRTASINILREIGVETGGSNVQFAVQRETGRLIVIEMNPRVSRSSALASKATGFPIAKVAAKLAIGYSLDELVNDIAPSMPASFEPTIDYIVTKIPRFTFEKFAGTDETLTTSMKSVGEAMAIGRNFTESLQKALRSLETGLTGLNPIAVGCDGSDIRADILAQLAAPKADRLLKIAEAIRRDISIGDIQKVTHFDPWFLAQIHQLVQMERIVQDQGLPQDERTFRALKSHGFSDTRLAEITGLSEQTVMARRKKLGITPVFKRIDSCAAEFDTTTPYLYSTYETPALDGSNECEAAPSIKKKIVILGSGPNRIGQGIEFDYCCCHASFALSAAGYETIMINCNPETVSTDYDTSDRLYFEPLTVENILSILEKEQEAGTLEGVIVQLGGQTPLKLAGALDRLGIPILGTSVDDIDLAEDRERFQNLVQELGLKQPQSGFALSLEQAETVAHKIGYPVLMRPSYVLGGRAMETIYSDDQLRSYMNQAAVHNSEHPVLIDAFLEGAIEIDVDLIADGHDVHIAGIMEHIEEAGIHSGDSACTLPPYSLPVGIVKEIKRQSEMLARALNVIGLMNIQFALKDGQLYLIEANPRASRTIPFVAKAVGSPLVHIAARVMAGEKLSSFTLKDPITSHVAVKEVVIPWARFPGVDVLLGPEMKSTGEVMGIDKDFAGAFYKAQLAAGVSLPTSGQVFLSVKDTDKYDLVPLAQQLVRLGYSLIATTGTAEFLGKLGISCSHVYKVNEGLRPHVLDILKSREVQLVINTTAGRKAISDSKSLRQTALLLKVPYFTTLAASKAAVQSLGKAQSENLHVESLQHWDEDYIPSPF